MLRRSRSLLFVGRVCKRSSRRFRSSFSRHDFGCDEVVGDCVVSFFCGVWWCCVVFYG